VEADRIVSTRRVTVDVSPCGWQAEAHPQRVTELGVIQGGVGTGRRQQKRGRLSSPGRGDTKPRNVSGVPGHLRAATGRELSSQRALTCGVKVAKELGGIEAVSPIIFGGGNHRT
jgi:hypothetical protein